MRRDERGGARPPSELTETFARLAAAPADMLVEQIERAMMDFDDSERELGETESPF